MVKNPLINDPDPDHISNFLASNRFFPEKKVALTLENLIIVLQHSDNEINRR